ncbi:MAG: hypothetical protein KC503_41000 [Myxococcales bacterium]|nr:hypothetical protein [Myxococcales bacterium]
MSHHLVLTLVLTLACACSAEPAQQLDGPSADLGADVTPRADTTPRSDTTIDVGVPDAFPGRSWAVAAGGSGDSGYTDKTYGAAVHAGSGDIIIAGTYVGEGRFGDQRVSSSGRLASYVARIDSAGTFKWVVSAAGSGQSQVLANDIAVDSAGNSYVIGTFLGGATFGSTTLSHTGQTFGSTFVAKLDRAGAFVWAKAFGGSGLTIAVDESGAKPTLLVAGSFSNTSSFGGTTLTATGKADIYVARLDGDGAVLWAQSAPTSASAEAKPVSIASDASGIWLSASIGVSTTFGATTLVPQGPGKNGVLARLDSGGNFVWAKLVAASESTAARVRPDGVGGVLAIGSFSGTLSLGGRTASAGNLDTWVARLDSSGSAQWLSRFGGPQPTIGAGIAVDRDGVYISGSLRTAATFGSQMLVSKGGLDAFVARLALADGTVRWALRGGGASDDYGLAVAAAPDGSAVVVGSFHRAAELGGEGVSANGDFDTFVWKLKLD